MSAVVCEVQLKLCIASQYICTFSGDHSVEVKLAHVHVEGSPFLVKAYDATKVKVTDINSGVVGKPVFFSSMYKIYFCLHRYT